MLGKSSIFRVIIPFVIILKLFMDSLFAVSLWSFVLFFFSRGDRVFSGCYLVQQIIRLETNFYGFW